MPARREPFVAPADRLNRPDPAVNDDGPATADLHEEATADLVEIAEPTVQPSSLRWAEQSRAARAESKAAQASPRQSELPTMPARESPRPDSRPAAASRINSASTASTHVDSAPAEPAAGSILCDRYLLERIIGTGATSVVWRARDLQWQGSATDSPVVALKLLRRKTASTPAAATRLRHEFQCATKLSHPNIVRVFDLHCASDSCFMTMELVEGKPLPAALRDRANLRESLARRILQGCAAALMHAHGRDVTHGDFKPDNIFVMADGSAKVANFGAAAPTCNADDDDQSSDRPRAAAVAPAYASPEVLEGQLPERRDDVFSFACVAYELLALQHPFEHGRSTDARDTGWIPPRAWSLSAPQWLALLAALSWQREQRTADVGVLLTALMTQPPAPADPHPRDELQHVPGVTLDTKPLSEEFMHPDRGWRYFVIGLIALIMVLIALR